MELEYPSGRKQRAGKYLYEGTPRYWGERRAIFEGFTTTDGNGTILSGVFLRSWAERLGPISFEYHYEITNPSISPLRVWWEILPLLGLDTDGTVDIPPGVSITYTREAAGTPIPGNGNSTFEADPPFGFSYAHTLLSSEDLPEIVPVENVTTAANPDGSVVLNWTHPDPNSIDGVEVRVYNLTNPEGTLYWFDPPATTGTLLAEDLSPGLNGIAVFAVRFGLSSQPVVVAVEQ